MKRITHILVSLTLSVMIILMGSGIAIVRCSHSGNTSVMTLAQSYNTDCAPESECMSVSVLKCSTMMQAPTHTLEHPQPIFAQPWLTPQAAEIVAPDFISENSILRHSGLLRHGPPREYLNLICVLII